MLYETRLVVRVTKLRLVIILPHHKPAAVISRTTLQTELAHLESHVSVRPLSVVPGGHLPGHNMNWLI